MSQKEFLDMIRACCRKLNLAGFLRKFLFSLSVGGGVGIMFQAVSFVIPMYYANVYTGAALLLAVVAAVIVSFIRRGSMEHAALVMDSFGFKERIITAYEHLTEDGGLFELQRKDAMEQLRNHRDRIQIPLWPHWKKTVLPAVLLALMAGLAFTPSKVKDQARELHKIHQEAKEKEEEIKEVLEEMEKLEESGQEALTPEQLAAFQEMMESLRSSMAEYQQASSAEALQAAGEKLDYKYGNMGSQMSDLAQSMLNGATASAMSAESMQAMADKLNQMSGTPSPAGGSLASSQDGDGNGQNGQGSSQNGQGDGQNGDGQGNGQNGQGNSQGGQGNGQGDDGNGQGGQGSGQNGQGNGQNGQGGGQGSGSGRGTGTANNSHDYVSIPNAIADSGNLTGNAVNHDDSEYFRAQNGLSWEGVHMSHEAVIGNYEKNAYEGIAAGRYPSGMENVIKDYFSSFN